ncbi:MAG: hypothetical protein NT049_08330 [Planctomycetota bacterium]|nr:hypothetical protein [Planctomycetota bacterium]
MRRIVWGLLLVTAATLVGCARAPEARYPNPMALPSSDIASVEKVAQRILLELNFEVVYPQSKPGRVDTEHLTGDSWFEFWRGDTVGDFQRVESSLHTIRRAVHIQVSPAPTGSQVSVKVDKERLSAPGSSPSAISQTYDLYNPRKTSLARQDEFKETQYTWLPMDRDDALEQVILERIQGRLGVAR